MIEYNRLSISVTLQLLAGWVGSPDERSNYYLVDCIQFLMKNDDAKRLMINTFGIEKYKEMYTKLLKYQQALSPCKMWLDALNQENPTLDKKPELRTKVYQQAMLIQIQLPLIKEDIYKWLVLLIENSNLRTYDIKRQHLRPIELKFQKQLRIKLNEPRDKHGSFDKRPDLP